MSEAATHSPSSAVVRKILVVDLGFLGDTIHTIPALWELRRHHPQAEIHVVTTPIGAATLSLAPCVDRTWVHPLAKPSPPWWKHLGLLRDLRRQRFDLSINFSGADRTLFVAACAGARHRLTRQAKTYRAWQRVLAGKLVAAPPRSLPVFEQRRRVLETAGYSLEPPRFDLRLTADTLAAVQAAVPPGSVHLSINASHPFKEWPLDSWANLTRLLLSEGVPAVVATAAASEREQGRLQSLVAAVADPRLHAISRDLSIPRLAGILHASAVHVGTDSGATHLAIALGVPTVSIYREYAGLQEWRPDGPQHAAITKPCHCVDQPRIHPDCMRAGTALCLAAIPAHSVAELVLKSRARHPSR